MEKTMNAKEMNKFTTDNIFLGIETLKDSIKKRNHSPIKSKTV